MRFFVTDLPEIISLLLLLVTAALGGLSVFLSLDLPVLVIVHTSLHTAAQPHTNKYVSGTKHIIFLTGNIEQRPKRKGKGQKLEKATLSRPKIIHHAKFDIFISITFHLSTKIHNIKVEEVTHAHVHIHTLHTYIHTVAANCNTISGHAVHAAC